MRGALRKVDLNLKNMDPNFSDMCLYYKKSFYDVISAFFSVFYTDFYRLLSNIILLLFSIGPVKC